jgi:[ribosomal protein S5]-alanine N-acetyltransferase
MLEIKFTPFPILYTERLVLRRVQKTDVNEMFFLRSDNAVRKYINKEPAKNLQVVSDFIDKLHELEAVNEGITWALTLKGSDKLIGTICFWNVQKEHFRAEIGYIMYPQYHGKGIMNEALHAILDYGFNVVKFHSVEAKVNPENAASINLLERNNFVREAYYKEDYYYDGKFLDTAVYSLLVSKYEPRMKFKSQLINE